MCQILNKNYGFAKGNNEGITSALKDMSVEFIALLNNDTLVDKNWLKELVNSANKNKNIGAVGSKLIFYDSKKINSLGIIPLKTGNALNFAKNLNPKDYNIWTLLCISIIQKIQP